MPRLSCSIKGRFLGRRKGENFFCLEFAFFNHTLRPEKGNTKGKEELPGEIFSADLTVSLRGEAGYLDYFELSKEKLHKEAVYL